MQLSHHEQVPPLRLAALGSGRDDGKKLATHMIRLDNISKQNGHQILFIDASMGLQKGEKVGLVGPNGAGKTTL